MLPAPDARDLLSSTGLRLASGEVILRGLRCEGCDQRDQHQVKTDSCTLAKGNDVSEIVYRKVATTKSLREIVVSQWS